MANAQTEKQKKEEKQTSVEKGRYINALRALVKEHGDIPALCACGNAEKDGV